MTYRYAGGGSGGGAGTSPYVAVNALDYIADSSPSEANKIKAGTSTTDVSALLTAAHALAGVGGEVYYPAGTYRCENVQYLSLQHIYGAGTLKQLDSSSNSILVATNWYNNVATAQAGAVIEGLTFASGASSGGGNAIVHMNFITETRGIAANMPVLLASETRNGTDLADATQNHLLENIDIRVSAGGGVLAPNPLGATDVKIRNSIFNNCGTGQTIAIIDVRSFAGWHIVGNKFYASPGRLLRATNQGGHAIIEENNFDWGCSAPSNVGTYNIAIDLTLSVQGGHVFANNICRVDASDDTRSYKFLSVTTANGGPIVHTGNRYINETALGAATDLFAFFVTAPTTADGISSGNHYDGFANTQIGNGEEVLGSQQFKLARVSTQFDKTSSTALAAITGLTRSVLAGEFYEFDVWAEYTCAAAGGIKFDMAGGTATATSTRWRGQIYETASRTFLVDSIQTALNTAVTTVGTSVAGYIRIRGHIIVNAAGTFAPRMAQDTSDGTATSILVGSIMRLTRVA
jgi:hypothetical protein